jgi:hypothetical protein
VYFHLAEKSRNADSPGGDGRMLRFQGRDGYIRCTVHVLNLIVGDISTLKAGNHSTAMTACDWMQEDKEIGHRLVLAQLRIMVL